MEAKVSNFRENSKFFPQKKKRTITGTGTGAITGTGTITVGATIRVAAKKKKDGKVVGVIFLLYLCRTFQRRQQETLQRQGRDNGFTNQTTI